MLTKGMDRERSLSFETSLLEFLEPEAVLTTDEAKRPFECDGLSAYRQIPRVVVLPETVEQVERVVQQCKHYSVPIVSRGAGTSLSGGALPLAEGCVISLAKFNRIKKVDAEKRIAIVEPGVRNIAITEAAQAYGLYYAPDPSSQLACSIGGNVAENAGGVHCLKYGLTVHNLLGAKILTSDGKWLELGGQALDSNEHDLLNLITGSEGLLGIVMEITVRLLVEPRGARVLMAAFKSVEEAGDAVAGIIAAGVIPAALEMMDSMIINAAEDFCRAGYPREAAAILLCEIDGSDAELDAQSVEVGEILRAHGSYRIDVSKDDEERLRFWQGRKSAFPAIGRIAPDYFCMDGTIPRHELSGVLQRISKLSSEYELPVANVFHAGDGNLHPLIAYDANRVGQMEKAEELGGKILELCVAVGGTVTGEHGVGVEKLDQMCVQFSAAELEIFHAIKNAFDPHHLLNPGKAVPTLHRCAELGAMHVKNGALPHPEIERF